ncbi:probable G-protein coupled receptor 173 [Oncorhynchus tshawytscha]|uniref:Probable G-protein coupled receptor 173 n=2 Tax=Oncorhynchus TaxID=8016 RepID=A0AAZ3S5V8_ONCTS|nr:probable G-protein coupled receptor 173 [Oncorhynchus kisutch]XP_024231745.1 probable G-protein coupled receptor 173 [Oncorhynchus tshawytscha]
MSNQTQIFGIDGPGSLLAVLASQRASSISSTSSEGISAAAVSTYVKLVFLGLILCVSLAGNLLVSLLVLRDRALHKAPYFFLLDLCLADVIRSAACFPFVLVSVHNSSAWTYSAFSCKLVAFLAVLFCFHAAFMLFCVAVTRYLAIAHHRFYAKRMTVWTCAAIICMVWTLAIAMASPPVFDVGTYKFIQDEDQCIFEHRYLKTNDTLGFMLMLAVVVLATHGFYTKLLLFEYKHRKMKPVQLMPAISQNWTFHGPGATGQAAANWIAGFGRGPMPPTLLGIRQTLHNQQQQRLLGMEEVRSERRLGRMFYIITLLFLVLWAPYIVACFWRVFVKSCSIPHRYLSITVWMSFAQAGVNPIFCLLLNEDLRKVLRAHLPTYSRTRQHQQLHRHELFVFTIT